MKIHTHQISRDASALHVYLWDKQDAGQVTQAENAEIVWAGLAVFEQSGLKKGPDADDLSVAVFRQMLHVMKQTLLKMYPELKDEVRNLGTERAR